MSDEKERGFRDDHGAALERAARLQEENERLRAELEEARKAKTDPPRDGPSKNAQKLPAAKLGLWIGLFGAVTGASVAISLNSHPAPPRPPPSFTIPPPIFSVAPMPSFAFERMPMPPILMHGASTAARPVPRPNEKLVEVRSHPRGAAITLGGRPAGMTPGFVRFKPDSCKDNICRATLTFEGREAALELTPETIDPGGESVGVLPARRPIGIVGHDFTIHASDGGQ